MRADLVLVGFGNVGQRFARLLAERSHTLDAEYDLQPRIVGIATRRHGSVFSAGGIDVGAALHDAAAGRALGSTGDDAPSRIIRQLAGCDGPLRVVVETTTLAIADGQPAIRHIEAALEAGCHAVTANKGPAAFAYRRLRDRAECAGRSFLFEGAVMDGVPVFNLVRETMPAVAVLGFRGVINSTTNHILTALENGEEFAPALARMQSEGIAEADASLDVDGWDAAAKTAALANVLMHAELTPHLVDRTGIGPESAIPAREAVRRGARLRLVASAARNEGGEIVAAVRPIELPGDDLLSGLRGTANALVLQTDLLGEVAIHQLGGGLTMTAYALLSDLITIRRRALSPGV
jgi:homoserine dehydrogenase